MFLPSCNLALRIEEDINMNDTGPFSPKTILLIHQHFMRLEKSIIEDTCMQFIDCSDRADTFVI